MSLTRIVAVAAISISTINMIKAEDPVAPAWPAANHWARSQEVYAVWYRVPPKSLARRRAGKDELTAAHNSLPLGTLVRITHLRNGKSAIVRITDRGVKGRRGTIDMCKEAAEKLQMVREGVARVRLEVLPNVRRVSVASPANP